MFYILCFHEVLMFVCLSYLLSGKGHCIFWWSRVNAVSASYQLGRAFWSLLLRVIFDRFINLGGALGGDFFSRLSGGVRKATARRTSQQEKGNYEKNFQESQEKKGNCKKMATPFRSMP